ncbi:MAG: DJ-1/PfpI family protein, partial [Actinobacteria bacterium]|nr:DJ-1/PfpI family protein [Actinomycetota bacterium]
MLFEDVEDIDYVGPLTVFGMASQLFPDELETVTITATGGAVRTSMGVSVLPHVSFASAGRIDILVVAGGTGHRAAMVDRELTQWIAERAPDAEIVSSVCSGAFILAAAGVLRDQPATAAWMALDRLRATFPSL